ncbi:MAG: bifunctional diguanylate cyclase/phosphodiesterase [Thermoleophilia bacterium]|nr:bifunctional diguanylate cyclase/phosphodiesterase [Thermoleophilia bacterium]
MAQALGARGEKSALFATERPPKLVLRFAVVLSLALALASALILIVVHHFALSQAERAAARHAGLVASSVLQREVTQSDLKRPVPSNRRHELDALLRTYGLTKDIQALSLVRRDGLVTYSTDHEAIGTTISGALAAEAATGTIVSHVPAAGANGAATDGKTLETYAPVGPDTRGGAALIAQSYKPIAHSARSLQLRVGAVLEGLLIVLFALLVPLLVRVTRRIQRQITRIHQQAFYDELTGLPNRTHFFERLGLAISRATDEEILLAVLLVDLNRFREINDTLGHEAGDVVLVEAARRLQVVAGDERLLARLGGDDFVFAAEFGTVAEAMDFAEHIRAAIEPQIHTEGIQLAVDATVGVAFYPVDGDDAHTLVKHAEVATYTAKEWRSGVLGYSPAVDPHDPEQLKLTAALREAADEGQIRLHYQPKIDLTTNAIAGFEALAYWDHPIRGLLPPGAFIPIAERTGAVRHVTRAVLQAAVEQLRDWSETELTVAVNLTAIDLLDADLLVRIKGLLDEHGVGPGRLCVELTESTVMADPDRARLILAAIADAGVRVSIDDFGTGHSSLSYLKDLPVQEVKIDRSFIADMSVSRNSRMIAKATIQLVHSLGLEVVAEGVEDANVHSELRGLGCDYAQGYLYGKPQPLAAVAELLADGAREAA